MSSFFAKLVDENGEPKMLMSGPDLILLRATATDYPDCTFKKISLEEHILLSEAMLPDDD